MLKNIFKLVFSDHTLEKKFKEESFQQLLLQRRMFLMLGIIIYFLFSILDYKIFDTTPEKAHLFLIIRTAISILGIIALFSSFSQKWVQYFETNLIITLTISALGIIWMAILTIGAVYYSYASGLIILLLFIYTFSLPFKKAIYLGWGAILSYNILVFLFHEKIELPLWYNFFLVNANIVGMFFAFYLERKNRDNFLLNQKLTSAYNEIQKLSLTDALTGAKNRRYFQKVIQEDLENLNQLFKENIIQKRAVKDTFYGLLLIDIDHFKDVNDQLGHNAGDRFLKQFTELIIANIRTDDTLIRWGGEEFLVILKNTQIESIIKIATTIKNRIADHPFSYDQSENKIHKTCSIGAIPFPFGDLSLENTIKIADHGLYYAKNHGRNRISFISENKKNGAIDPFNIEEAFATDRLTLISKI